MRERIALALVGLLFGSMAVALAAGIGPLIERILLTHPALELRPTTETVP